MTGGYPPQRASNAENCFHLRRHHDLLDGSVNNNNNNDNSNDNDNNNNNNNNNNNAK